MKDVWKQDEAIRQNTVQQLAKVIYDNPSHARRYKRTPTGIEKSICNMVQTKEQYVALVTRFIHLVQGKANNNAGRVSHKLISSIV